MERRAPYELDVDALIATCAANGTMLEINASPHRRDLDEIHSRSAAAAGVSLVINSDAHSTGGLQVLRFGIWTARRAWLTAADVANTLPWPEFAAKLGRSGR